MLPCVSVLQPFVRFLPPPLTNSSVVFLIRKLHFSFWVRVSIHSFVSSLIEKVNCVHFSLLDAPFSLEYSLQLGQRSLLVRYHE